MMHTRANRLVSALLAAVLSLGLLAGCASKKAEPQRFSTIFYDVFDTVTQVIAYCDSEEEFNKQMDALHEDLVAYNQLYDIYNDYEGVNNIKPSTTTPARPLCRWMTASSPCWNWR